MLHTADPLANPIWHSLTGHQHLATTGVMSGFYDPEVSPFAAVKTQAPEAFEELERLAGSRRNLAFFNDSPPVLPAGWAVLKRETLLQLVCPKLNALPETAPHEIRVLAPEDESDMLALATATEPGPFASRTPHFGRYLGIRAVETGELVAMAGERLRTDSAVEVSAVCTANSHRGQGLARKLVHAVASNILEKGQLPFLHVRTLNTSALTLYEKMGFVQQRTIHLTVACSPGQ